MAEAFTDSWESLRGYSVPEWFMDAKFGIFVHWGPYAVPAFESEWYPRNMYQEGSPEYEHHLEEWGDHESFGFKDFIPRFRGENWDPKQWVDLFVESGAEYVIPVAEHHDGFAMYDSDYTEWNAVEMGPERDVIGDLGAAVRDAGLRYGLSSHYAWNWRYYTYDDEFDTVDPENAGLYCRPHDPDEPADEEFLKEWAGRTKQLIDDYHPAVLWFDFGWHYEEFASHRPEIAAYYYNRASEWGDGGVLNHKHGLLTNLIQGDRGPHLDYTRDKFPAGTAVNDIERGGMAELRREYWQTDTSVSNTAWGYVEDHEYKTVTELVQTLVDVVSKNGNLLLNVGPKPDGTLPSREVDLLRGIGKWLETNGEAIYGTRTWWTYGEGPTNPAEGQHTESSDVQFTPEDIRFTRGDDALYAIVLGWAPEVRVMTLAEDRGFLSEGIETVDLLGSQPSPSWYRDAGGLHVTMPNEKPCEHAYTLKIFTE